MILALPLKASFLHENIIIHQNVRVFWMNKMFTRQFQRKNVRVKPFQRQQQFHIKILVSMHRHLSAYPDMTSYNNIRQKGYIRNLIPNICQDIQSIYEFKFKIFTVTKRSTQKMFRIYIQIVLILYINIFNNCFDKIISKCVLLI